MKLYRLATVTWQDSQLLYHFHAQHSVQSPGVTPADFGRVLS